ncbi:restriction endonuclease subunit S [Nocardia sp. NPDC004750]
MPEWPAIPLRTLVVQHEPALVVPAADETVRFAGVRWYGAGLFIREERQGSEVKGKCYALKPGTLIYNRLFAWKQSFAVVSDDYQGVVVSNEFPQFDVDTSRATPEFLALCCSSPSFAEKALGQSTGSAAVSRNRLKEADFLGLAIECPPIPVQAKVIEVIAAVDQCVQALGAEESSLRTLLAAARQSMLSAAPKVPLSSVCSLDATLVDPRSNEYADLPHVGVDAIEKGTGRIADVRSAREDGVISGKYLFSAHDVVYAKIRPGLRKAALPGFVGLCSADVYPLAPRAGVLPELLREVLLEDSFTNHVTTLSTRLKMPKVNRKELFSSVVAMPSTDDERKRVATALEGIRRQLDAVVREADQLKTTRASLLDALLTRKIEVSI